MATIFVQLFYLYLAIGIVFALWFVLKGVDRLDPGMHGVPYGVRFLIFPGSVLLWIVLFFKYIKQK